MSSGGSRQLSIVPPGFRFHPTDEELLYYYLRKKVSYEAVDLDVIREVDLNKLEPWDLKDKCRIGSGIENEWYFFSHKDKKYPTGTRTNRATMAGFWKATGRDKAIYLSDSNNSEKIGMRKTLVFYTGRAPHGLKSDWIMHEYRLDDNIDNHYNNYNAGNQVQEDGWVVCRVFRKKMCNNTGGDNIISNRECLQLYHQPVATQLDRDHDEPHVLGGGHFPTNNNTNSYMKLPSTGSTSTFATDPRLQNLMMSQESMHLPQLWSPESTPIADMNMSLLSSRPSCSRGMISNTNENDQFHPNTYLLRPVLTTNNTTNSSYITNRGSGNGNGGSDWSFLNKLLQASNAQNLNTEDSIITRFNYSNTPSLANGAATDANTSSAQRSYTRFGTSVSNIMF